MTTVNKTLVRLGRLGYAVKGIVYVMMGILALVAERGYRKHSTDTHGAIAAIGDAPFGRFVLVIIAIGLFGYAAWRLVSAATDAERKGDDPTGAAQRIGAAGRGLAYAALGVWTIRYLTHKQRAGGDAPRSLTSRVLELPAGKWIVIAFGLSMIGYALYQLYRAISEKFLKHLSLAGTDQRTRTLVSVAGKFGIIARGAVFGMIGMLFIKAGRTYNPSKAGGIHDSLVAIAQEPWGRILYFLVALGLVGFGLFQIATARFRIMRAT